MQYQVQFSGQNNQVGVPKQEGAPNPMQAMQLSIPTGSSSRAGRAQGITKSISAHRQVKTLGCSSCWHLRQPVRVRSQVDGRANIPKAEENRRRISKVCGQSTPTTPCRHSQLECYTVKRAPHRRFLSVRKNNRITRWVDRPAPEAGTIWPQSQPTGGDQYANDTLYCFSCDHITVWFVGLTIGVSLWDFLDTKIINIHSGKGTE